MSAEGPPHLPDLDSGPRNFITTDQDHGGVALTICTLMTTWAVLCFFVRVYMRATVSGPFGMDDWLCTAATLFGVTQMVASVTAISMGFGKAVELLTQSQIDAASKAVYSAQLLYIITNALTKCSVALLLARLIFIKSRVHACYGIAIASVVWGIAAFIAEAVRCVDILPWRTVGPQCANLFLAWQLITAFDVIIEAILLTFPLWLVWKLQTDFQKKFTVVAVFWLRSPVIAAALLRIHYLAQTTGSPEPLLRGVIPFILLNIEMHYGLMASTMPTLRPFVGAFNTGWGTYDSSGQSGYGQSSNGSHAMNSLGKSRRKSSVAPGTQLSGSEDKEMGADLKLSRTSTHVRSIGLKSYSARHHSSCSDTSRQGIMRTTTAELHYEPSEVWSRGDLASSHGEDSIDHANFCNPPLTGSLTHASGP